MKGVSRSEVCNGVLCATTISGQFFIAILLGKFHHDHSRAVGKFPRMAAVKSKGIFPKCPFTIQVEKLRLAPPSCKLAYCPRKWPGKWVTGVIVLVTGIVTPFFTSRGPHLSVVSEHVH